MTAATLWGGALARGEAPDAAPYVARPLAWGPGTVGAMGSTASAGVRGPCESEIDTAWVTTGPPRPRGGGGGVERPAAEVGGGDA